MFQFEMIIRLKSCAKFADKLTMINTVSIVNFCLSSASKLLFGLVFLFLSSCSFSGKITPINSSSSAINNDGLSVSDKTVVEYGIASLTVSLGKTVSQNVSFNYYTQNQTAVSGTDYTGVSGSATIPAGQSQVIVSVPIADNYVKTANKTFFFNISSATNAEISSASSIVQIQDDDFNPMTGVASFDSGTSHTCALTTSGGVKCWGSNQSGRLGDGTTTSRAVAGDVFSLTSGVASVSVGHTHSCAVTTSGGLKCWGFNGNGRLGDGTTTTRLTPVDVSGLTSGVASVSVGNDHTCAVTTTGGAKCWGYNGDRTLGDGTTTDRWTPVDVTGLTSGVAAIAAGEFHTCALTTTGGARCWGDNASGQVGDGSGLNRSTSVNVTGLTSGVAAITTDSSHTCAVTTTGGVKCWGTNNQGQIGDGTTTTRLTPVDVTGLTSGVSAAAVGNTHSCALMTSGNVKCWGQNLLGQLGNGTTTDSLTAVDVSGLSSGVVSLNAAPGYNCALMSSAGLKCWGSSTNGQLGIGRYSYMATATDPNSLSLDNAKVSVGSSYVCVLTTTSGVKCWGGNTNGQLGDGTTTSKLTAVDVTGLTSGVTAISTSISSSHTCAVTAAGGVKCWGLNTNGQLGDGTTTQRLTAVDVTGLSSGVSSVFVGSSHSCALTTVGGVKCWGSGSRLGDGTSTQSATPVDVTGLTTGVASVSVGSSHSCAITTSAGLKCWGVNGNGQLGDGTTTSRLTAVDVTGLTSGIASVSAGSNHSCALTTSGGVKCWGLNANGRLGDGTTTNRLTAVDVIGLSTGIASVSAGASQTCALTTSGGVMCWGQNNNGELGNGTTTQSLTPLDVLAMTTGNSEISVGNVNTCALTTSGGVKCWGSNSSGQLGNNYNTTTPQTVVAP